MAPDGPIPPETPNGSAPVSDSSSRSSPQSPTRSGAEQFRLGAVQLGGLAIAGIAIVTAPVAAPAWFAALGAAVLIAAPTSAAHAREIFAMMLGRERRDSDTK